MRQQQQEYRKHRPRNFRRRHHIIWAIHTAPYDGSQKTKRIIHRPEYRAFPLHPRFVFLRLSPPNPPVIGRPFRWPPHLREGKHAASSPLPQLPLPLIAPHPTPRPTPQAPRQPHLSPAGCRFRSPPPASRLRCRPRPSPPSSQWP